MTIRNLPKAPAISMRAGVSSDIAPSALARWQMDIRAAADEDKDNTISVLGAIGQDFFGEGVTARRISAALRSIGERDVVVNINSPGGDFFEGLAIYNLLREHKGAVTVKVLGIAASAASIVAMAGDRVEVPRAGFLMIHNTWVMAMGDRHDLREFADLLEPFDKAAAGIYMARSGLDEKTIGKMMDKETWIGGADAVDKGFADALLPSDEIAKDAKAAADLTVHAGAKLNALLAKAGVSRSERARLIEQLKSGTQIAAEGDTQNAVADCDIKAGHAVLASISV
jgi:ATP-dependent Clp protease, protease subunit